MSDMHAANLLWRMENMDECTRRRADERVGLFVHMLRRAAGSGTTRARRQPEPRPSTAPAC
jgi:hypothetical protein